MPLLMPTYTTLLFTNLSSVSYDGFPLSGPMLLPLCTAIATGVTQTALMTQGQVIVPALVGPSFGTGIIIDGSAIAEQIANRAKELFQAEGPILKDVCRAIGSATQMYFMMATLISDTNGPVQFPQFSSATQQMKNNIVNAAPMFKGEKWPDFADAIATGICRVIGSSGNGVVAGAAIPGVGSGIVFIM